MIRYIYSQELHAHPTLADAMFRDRAHQFRDRMGWDVSVDARGWEQDQYDAQGPLYIVYEDEDGGHAGSGRLMPTTAPTMIGEHFTHLTDGVSIQSPTIWEITRFCISPQVKGRRKAMEVTTSLLLAGVDVGLRFGLDFYVAVFDEPMLRVYKSLDFAPDVMGEAGEAPNRVFAGLWEVSQEARNAMAARVRHEEAIARAAHSIEFRNAA